MRKTRFLILLVLIAAGEIAADTLPAGRFIWSSDGNIHDPDDILGTTVALSIIALKNAQSKVPVFIYADHIWETSEQEQVMIDIVNGTKALWGGFEGVEFYNAYQEELKNPGVRNKAVQAIIREINKSTASDPLTIGSGGPRQIVIEALKAADPSRLQYVTFVGHGTNTWNDKHSPVHKGYNYSELLATGVKEVRIANQNGHFLDNSGIERFKCKFSDVIHWKDNSNPYLKLLWDHGQMARKDYFDGSDAGIVWWYFMGNDEDGNFHKLEQLILSQSPVMPSSP